MESSAKDGLRKELKNPHALQMIERLKQQGVLTVSEQDCKQYNLMEQAVKVAFMDAFIDYCLNTGNTEWFVKNNAPDMVDRKREEFKVLHEKYKR